MTKTLKGEIGYFDEVFGELVPRRVGLDLTPESGVYLAEGIEAATLLERWAGSLVCEIVPPYNGFTKEVRLKCEQSAGRQGIQNLESLPADTLFTEIWSGSSWNPGIETGFSGEMVIKGEDLKLEA